MGMVLLWCSLVDTIPTSIVRPYRAFFSAQTATGSSQAAPHHPLEGEEARAASLQGFGFLRSTTLIETAIRQADRAQRGVRRVRHRGIEQAVDPSRHDRIVALLPGRDRSATLRSQHVIR